MKRMERLRNAWTNRKTAYRLPPCPPYDVEATESWLTDMAGRGLHLASDGIFAGVAMFERGERRQVQYRLEAAMKDTSMFADNMGAPDAEEIAINERYGWEYVAIRGQFHVYRSMDRAGSDMDGRVRMRERNTDPAVQALAIKEVQKRQRDSLFNIFFWALIYPLLYRLDDGYLLMVIYLGTGFSLWGGLLTLWLVGSSLAEYLHLRGETLPRTPQPLVLVFEPLYRLQMIPHLVLGEVVAPLEVAVDLPQFTVLTVQFL